MISLGLDKFVPDFARVETALSFHEADRVPNFEVYVAKCVAESVLGSQVPDGVAGEVIYRPRFGYDYIYVMPPYRRQPVYSRRESLSAEADGKERRWVDQHAALVTDWESLKNYTEYPDPSDPLDLSIVDEALQAVREMAGNVGVGALLPSAPFSEINLLMGYDNFCMNLYDNYELCEALVKKIGEVGVAAAEQLVKKDLDFVFFGDDMAYSNSMMISPDIMRKLFFPWYRKFISICRDAGKLVLFHSDGNIASVIPDFIDAGLNALNPVEPQAMDIVELKNKYYGKLAFAGNIDVDLLARGTPEEIESLVKTRLEKLKGGGGYMLGSSNSVCDYVKAENYAAMISANYSYGRYL